MAWVARIKQQIYFSHLTQSTRRILKERPWFPESVPYGNFDLRCIVSEIKRCYCKPDMTSSWFLRQGAPHAIFHNGFWKSDHDFLIAFYCNFLVTMHGFRDNEVLLQTGYDVIVIYPLGRVSDDFSWRILKERPWLPISLEGTSLSQSASFELFCVKIDSRV